MNRQIKLYLLLALFSMVMASPAMADGVIFGANTGTMNIDDPDVTDPRNMGFMVGYEVGVGLGDVAVEGEVTRTVSNGDLNGADVKVGTEALYVALRTAGPIYFKGRVGTLQEKVEIGNVSGTDSGSSYSLGIGFSLGLVQAELDFTRVESDINYVSLGVVF